MVGKERILALFDEVISASPADQTEISVMTEDQWLTRFANNTIHQNVNEVDHRVMIRAVVGKKIGAVTVNSLDVAEVKAAVEKAISQARLLPDDPGFPGLQAFKPAPEIPAVDQATAEMSPVARAERAHRVISMAKEKGLEAYGYFSTQTSEVAVANSLGVRAYHAGTEADCLGIVTNGTPGGASGYARLVSRCAGDICPDAVAEKAVLKCVNGQNPQPLPPGDYEVILEEEAVSELVSSIGMAFDASAIREGRSPLAGRFGQKLLGDNITVVDDAHNLGGLPMPFDFEGCPTKRLMMVENGVAREAAYDSRSAVREGKESTGHALPAWVHAWGMRAVPTHVFVQPGNATLEDMIKSTRKGVLVTRLWYNRVVHPMKTLITGMTRDGTFYVENGEIKYPILNLRYTQSVVEALNNVEMIGKEAKLRALYFGTLCVPAMKISKFTFTGATEH